MAGLPSIKVDTSELPAYSSSKSPPWNAYDASSDRRRVPTPVLQSSTDHLSPSPLERTSQVDDYGENQYLEQMEWYTNRHPVLPFADDAVVQAGPGFSEAPSASGLEICGTRSTGAESISLRSNPDSSSSLLDLIRGRSIEAASAEGRTFYPINDLEEVVTRTRVRQELSNLSDLDGTLDKIFVPRKIHDHKTRVFKIFVILTLMGKPGAIKDFIDDDIYDLDLPFERATTEGTPKARDQYLRNPQIPRRGGHNEIGIFKRWGAEDVENFMEKQHAVCVPIFDFDTQPGALVSHYHLHGKTILPYIYNAENGARGVGRSDVWKVRIHPAHIICKALGSNMSLAVKQLNHRVGKPRTEQPENFIKEARNLRGFASHDHDFIIKLLCTFQWRNHYYFLFPWADGNLYDLWSHYPDPLAPLEQSSTARWFSKQCLGLATALRDIHHGDAHSSTHLNTQKKNHGKHGNIKPENILYFQTGSDENAVAHKVCLAHLKISDFGEAELHSTTSMEVNVAGVFHSPSYSAPELRIKKISIPSCDIFSLACVLLEFVTWYLHGFQAVKKFREERLKEKEEPRFYGEFKVDSFFRHVPVYVDEDRHLGAMLKSSVTQEIRELLDDQHCSGYISDLLVFIRDNLLRMDPKNRADCDTICDIFHELDRKCRQNDKNYCTEMVKQARGRSKTNSSLITDMELPEGQIEIVKDPKTGEIQHVELKLEKLGMISDHTAHPDDVSLLSSHVSASLPTSPQTNLPMEQDVNKQKPCGIERTNTTDAGDTFENIFSVGNSVSTKPTAPSKAEINDESPHDLGYDGTATNYTSPWQEHPYSKTLIRGLAQHLYEEVKSFSRDESVLDRISAALPDLVRAFALRLGYSSRTTDDRDVALFLRRNRLLIGEAFNFEIEPEEVQHDLELERVKAHRASSFEMEPEDVQHDLELERVKAHRMEQWQSQVKSHDPADIEISNHRDDNDLPKEAMELDEIDVVDDIAPQEIAKYRKIITGSAQYSWLLADMRRLCTLEPGLPEDLMEKVRDTVRAVLPRNIPISNHSPMPGCEVTFEIPWDLCGFWEKEKFREKITRGLENAITITGSAEDAQATTAGEYLTQTWPVTAKHTMKLVKKLVNGLDIPSTASESLPDGTSMYAQMEGGRLRITATGAEDTIVEVGQQFIWLAAALRSSPHDDGIAACLPTIGKTPGLLSSSPTINIDFALKVIASREQGLDRAPGYCWQDMFRNPVVVGGFPILKKPGHGLGLEMPLRLMAALAGSERLSEFSGRTYIKGYSAMVVATAVLTNTVVWHYCYNKQGGRIAYGDHDLQSCPQVSMQQLTKSRHIVGWCSTCKVYAGAADALYESIGPSHADSPSSGMILDRINLSFSHFGVGGGASLAMCTRVKPKHYRPKDYVGMIEWVKTTYVVMWDEETKIGWLVNGTNAILHLARAKLHSWHNNRIYAKLLLIKPEELKDDGDRDPESAACTLLDQKNRRLKIWIASDEIKKTHDADKSDDDEISSTYLLFADVVEELVDKFEILFDEQADRAGHNGVNLRRQVRRHLEGWDFRDVLQGSEISPRQVTLEFGGWGWVNFARSINVVTLIGRRFGQLIRPAQCDEVCAEWQSVKKKKYYLAASIFDLKEIRRNKSSKISHLLWHSPQDPLAKCPRCGQFDQRDGLVSTRASNDTVEHHVPVQTFWPTRILPWVKTLKEPQYLKQVHSDGGAVIFENVVTPLFTWAAGADSDEENLSPPGLQPKNSANEGVDAEKPHTDTQNLPRRVKQKLSNFLHPSPPQQSGGESTSDTRAGSASVSEDAGQGQLPVSVNTTDTSLASDPAQDCQYAEEIVQKRRKLENHIYK